MRLTLRVLYRDLLSVLSLNLFLTFVLILVTAFASFYSLLWPAYMSMKTTSAETIPWSLECTMDPGDTRSVERIEELIHELYPNAKTIPCMNSTAFFNKSGAEERVDAKYLLENDDTVWPIDVYGSPDCVLEGNPYTGDGTIVQWRYALRYGIHAGSKIFLGYEDEGYTGEGEQEYEPDILHMERTVSAIVNDSGANWAIATPRSKGTISKKRLAGDYVSTVYVLGLNEQESLRCVKKLKEKLPKDSVYFCFGLQEVKDRLENIKLEQSNASFMENTRLIAVVVTMAVAVLDCIRRSRRCKRDFAILNAMGARKSSILSGSMVFALCWFGLVMAISISIAYVMAKYLGGMWIPPEAILQLIAILAGTAVAASLVQAAITAWNLRKESLFASLLEEK